MKRADNSLSTWRIVAMLIACAAVLSLVGQGVLEATAAEVDSLEVAADSGGGVRATARVLFPAKTEVIQGLLTDYAHWPDLFEVQMRIADVTVENGIAIIDLRIDHAVMPGERRLVTESRAMSGGGLVTDLKAGDFKRYHRVWRLKPSSDGSQTLAEFELVVQPELMIPDWLIVIVTRQELASHFRILKHKALEQGRSLPRADGS